MARQQTQTESNQANALSTESYAETPIVITESKPRRIKSISLEFTADQSNAIKLDLLWDALESQGALSKADQTLMDRLGPIVDAEEDENLERILKESDEKKDTFIAESKALSERSEKAKAQKLQQIDIELQADLKHLAPLSEEDAAKLIELKAKAKTTELNAELEEFLTVQKNGAKKSRKIKVEREAVRLAALLPSQVNLTEAARQLMPGQSIDIQTTNHSGQEVTIEAVTVL